MISAKAVPAEPTCATRGVLIVNADDWGRSPEVTDRTLECIESGAVSSVSAMLFMDDSERGANIARERRIDAGLHLNLTAPFTASGVPRPLAERHERVSSYLRRRRLAQLVFHPGLVRAFEYVVKAQCDEFRRLYGEEVRRIDGHHHMHLCANVIMSGLLPEGTTVRRNFSFERGDKSWLNRMYRRLIDRKLASRHAMADLFFSLPPLEPPARIQKILSLAQTRTVELETHPVDSDEYRFLTGGELLRRAAGLVRVADRYEVVWSGR